MNKIDTWSHTNTVHCVTVFITYILSEINKTTQNRHIIYVSESNILGPIDNLCNIEILVSFDRAMFEDYSFK